MKRIELLAPAGSLDKLKMAVFYGADAVYIGGQRFSLRARASNFTLEDIEEGVKYAHQYNAKVYVTMNIIPHNEDLEGLDEYLLYLDSVNVDGIIVSSVHIIKRSIELGLKLETHISTQLSCNNSYTCNMMAKMGATRVVLAREASIQEINNIRQRVDIGLEVFIHGGMCSSYSGRCMLSNHFVSRDANRGGCAHSCRWNYDIFDDNKKLNEDSYFNMASKDLMALDYITKLIDIGVDSLKIEGRMKSEYYIACIVRSYRSLIDSYYQDGKVDYERISNEIRRAENRLTSYGFLKGVLDEEGQLFASSEIPTKEFVGRVLDYDKKTNVMSFEQRNYFSKGDMIEIFGPNDFSEIIEVEEMEDEQGQILEIARHPKQIIKMKVLREVKKNYLMRKVDKPNKK